LVEWNDTKTDYPWEKCIHELIAEQATKTPEAVAVVFENQQLSYAQLDSRANQVARYLQSLGVGPEVVVGLCVERSLEMVVGLLGILKAGGAYLPLDPSYPKERLSYMLADAQSRVLVTQRALVEQLPQSEARLVLLDEEAEKIKAQSANGLIGRARPDNPAYVLYTSGSTGRPKGVAMPHRPLVNLIFWEKRWAKAGMCRTLQFASLGFDPSFQEIFGTLSCGGEVRLIDQDSRLAPERLFQYICNSGIQRLYLPNVALQALAEAALENNQDVIEELGCGLFDIMVAGEQLRISPQTAGFFKRLTQCRLNNYYGPTECHVVTALSLPPQTDAWPLLPSIGSPIANTQIYILDYSGGPVAIGIPGEIYIGGESLARGYVNRPELTAERFIPDPFSLSPGARMYQSGDLGRWLPDGTIEFLGRIDQQVKIRGFRIEPGEIEAALQRYAGIEQVVVVAREDSPGEKRLVGYVVSSKGAALDAGQLRSYLRESLPEYMVPSALVMLEALPLTASGKLDRRGLPAPISGEKVTTYLNPQTPGEAAIATLWAEVLKLDRAGLEDNFFDMGGHSILATRLVARIRDLLEVEVPVRMLFEAPTVRLLAERVEQIQRERSDGVIYVPEDRNSLLTRIKQDIEPSNATDGNVPRTADNPLARVFLTGATGFLGAFILEALLEHTNASVYCLVRPSGEIDPASRLMKTLSQYRVWRDAFRERTVVVAGDLAQPDLGMSSREFARCSEESTAVLHCGALVDFSRRYDDLRPANVLGTKEILRLSTASILKPIHYISTRGVYGLVTKSPDFSSEEFRNELGSMDGYLQSKWVAEQVLGIARSRGIPVTIYRPGRIWGAASSGAGPTQDLIWLMIKASIEIRVLPDIDLRLGMAPVDYLSKTIVEMVSRSSSANQTYNLADSYSITVGTLREYLLAAGYRLELTGYAVWRQRLTELAGKLDSAARILPLLPQSWEQLPRVSASLEDSPAVQTEPVFPETNAEIFERYLNYYRIVEFIPAPF
jgi:amino acid adenylation domain-containing protein/thioester reductase-like protein